jgi:hypothetical protein
MSQTKAQLLDNIKDNVQLDARNSLRFADTDSSHYVAFKAPATVSSNVTWTLPAADGSANYVLATDGSGTLSWIADPAGQWTTSGSNIYFTGGNVGIGDTSPSNPLSVTGASAFNGDVTFTGASYNVTWDKSADDLIFNDNAKAAFGTSSDLTIYHNGTDSGIVNNTGGLYIQNNGTVFIGDVNGNEFSAKFIDDGAVELYYDNVKKFETTSSGITVSGNANIPDGSHIYLGASNDLDLYHAAGADSFLINSSGQMYQRYANNLYIQVTGSNENAIVANANGSVELYHDNVKKFETSSSGVKMPDSAQFELGTGSDLKMWHSGSHSFIRNETGNLTIEANGAGDDAINIVPDGAVELYYDGSVKLETSSQGIKVQSSSWTTLNIVASGNDATIRLENEAGADHNWTIRNDFSEGNDLDFRYNNARRMNLDSSGNLTVVANLDMGDNDKILLGTGDDLQIYHDGSDNWIKNAVAGKHLKIIDADGDNMAIFYQGSGVALYHNTNKKFETTSVGATLTGRLSNYYDATQVAGLYLRNSNDSGTAVQFVKNDGGVVGSISQTASATSYNTSSDYRLKENEVAISDGITRLKTLKPYRFNFKIDSDTTVDGFFAHEVTPAVPEAITGEKDGTEMQGIDQSKLVPLLTAALQEAITKIETLETKVAALESA